MEAYRRVPSAKPDPPAAANEVRLTIVRPVGAAAQFVINRFQGLQPVSKKAAAAEQQQRSEPAAAAAPGDHSTQDDKSPHASAPKPQQQQQEFKQDDESHYDRDVDDEDDEASSHLNDEEHHEQQQKNSQQQQYERVTAERTMILRAMGRAMHKAVTCAELVKRRVEGLHQVTHCDSYEVQDTYEPLEEGLSTVHVQRRVATICITLSKDQLDASDPGYQAPLTKEQFEQQPPIDQTVLQQRTRGTRGGRSRGSRGRGRGRKNANRGASQAVGNNDSSAQAGDQSVAQAAPANDALYDTMGDEAAAAAGVHAQDDQTGAATESRARGSSNRRGSSSKTRGRGRGNANPLATQA